MYMKHIDLNCETEVFMVMKIKAMVFWVVTLYYNVVEYDCFKGPCYFHLQDELTGAWKWI
jgi:hypothetical protein